MPRHLGAPRCRHEYVKLTAQELRCGKLRLMLSAAASAEVFAAGKRSSGRQRKIWNGKWISLCAARPPYPRRLVNPSSFVDCEAPEAGFYLSKRDASTFFYILLLPPALRPWLGQADTTISELMQVGGLAFHKCLALIDDIVEGQQPLATSRSRQFTVAGRWASLGLRL